MPCPNDRRAAAADIAARSARRAALLLLLAMGLAACAQRTPVPPTTPPVLERPVLAMRARDAERVLVPTAAVVTRAGIPGVFVLTRASAFPPVPRDAADHPLPQARFRMVKTGKQVRDQVEALSGLSGDETLVLGELATVRDGSPIVVRR